MKCHDPSLFKELGACTALEVLRLSGDKGFDDAFIAMLATLKNLKVFSLDASKLTRVPKGLERLAHLERFELGESKLNGDQLTELRCALPNTLVRLRTTEY